MRALDLAILVAYLGATVFIGSYFSRSQRSLRDYFVSGRSVPWWAVMASIVATETSTVTFISVPGYGFGANYTFLQLVFGYLVGRVVISLVFIPWFFRGDLLTVYQLLGTRFGPRVTQLASSLFLLTRSLADGFRLFATGLVLAALLTTLPGAWRWAQTWSNLVHPQIVIVGGSVLAIGLATIVYTFLGGMRAVIWTDVTQLAVYLTGAGVAAVTLLYNIPGGWEEVLRVGAAGGKFTVFDFSWDLTRGYTFWSGVVGGAFLTTATHGTDQMMVQRYLCSRSAGAARLALLVSGVVILVQFALFLLIGTMLYVFFTGHASGELAAITVNGVVRTDQVFPLFVVTHLPQGVVGLVIAAIFAAAMSTLSSSLNSSAAAAIGDFYLPGTRGARSEAHYLRVSRWLTVVWGVVQVSVAMVAIKLSTRVVDEVLGIASFTNGVILGMFFLGTFTRRVQQRGALAGIIAGAAVMLTVKLATGVSWQWYVLIGSTVTFLAGVAASGLLQERALIEAASSQRGGRPQPANRP